MCRKRRSGFVLTELLLAMALGAIIVTIVSPELTRARVDSNERAALTALRSIVSAQAQLASSGEIDTDGNRVGEYGYLGELAGSAPLRVHDVVVDSPALDASGPGLPRPLLPPAFTNIDLLAGEAEVERGGYRFKMYLPDATLADQHIAGVPETGASGIGGATAGFFPDASNGEMLWGCYAWPDRAGSTGQRAFFVNQESRFVQTANAVRSASTVLFYDGPGGGPRYDAAFSDIPLGPNGVTGMGAPLGTPPRKAGDGNLWTRIGR